MGRFNVKNPGSVINAVSGERLHIRCIQTSLAEFRHYMHSGDLLAYLSLNRLSNDKGLCSRCYFIQIQHSNPVSDISVWRSDGRMNGRTDRRTDEPTDRRTDGQTRPPTEMRERTLKYTVVRLNSLPGKFESLRNGQAAPDTALINSKYLSKYSSKKCYQVASNKRLPKRQSCYNAK